MAYASVAADHSAAAFQTVESLSAGGAVRAEAGRMAPLFTLPDADMEMFELGEALRSHNVVLYFYPRDSMPSSRRIAIAYTDHDDAFDRLETIVVGVSLDDCLVHADFRDEHGISVRLLSDPDADVCALYGVMQEREMGGVMKPAVQRKTFVIGRDGVIHHVLDDAGSQDPHADPTVHVLELLKELERSRNGNRQEQRRNA